jgi:hypothetical protein
MAFTSDTQAFFIWPRRGGSADDPFGGIVPEVSFDLARRTG